MKMITIHPLGWVAACVLGLLVAGGVEAEGLTWVGCGITKKAFMAELAAAFQRKNGIEIQLQGGGATKGIRETAKGTADIGGSCRYKIDDQAEEQGVKMIPIAWDALVAVVYKDNPIDSISLDQLRGVYLGEITNWKELGGNDQPIELFAREGKISGVGRTIRQLVFSDADIDFGPAKLFPSSGPLEKAVETSPNAIGMTGISSAHKRDFKILKLDGKEPTYDNIKNGNYLLYRPLYLVVQPTGLNRVEVDKFLEFAYSREGRKIVQANGVVPYLEAVQLTRKQREQWSRMRKEQEMRANE